MRIGAAVPAALHGGGIVTAYNPASRLRPRDANERANARLRREIERAGLRFMPALALGTGAAAVRWDEPGFAVLGCGREAIVRLGARFGQNAAVWMDAATGVARLVATRALFAGRAVGADLPPAG